MPPPNSQGDYEESVHPSQSDFDEDSRRAMEVLAQRSAEIDVELQKLRIKARSTVFLACEILCRDSCQALVRLPALTCTPISKVHGQHAHEL